MVMRDALRCWKLINIAVMLCLSSHVVYAEDTAESSQEISDVQKHLSAASEASMGNLVEVTLGLLTVLVLIFVIAWLVKRYGAFNASAGGNLRIVGGLSLGQRERVMLVQVGEKQLLLGVAPGRVETLYVLEEPIEVASADEASGDFSEKLQLALKQRLGK